jgi:hypothetical protein
MQRTIWFGRWSHPTRSALAIATVAATALLGLPTAVTAAPSPNPAPQAETSQTSETTVDGLTPADLRDAYGLPADGGAGALIAVIALQDDPDAEANLAVYRERFGLSPCTGANGCFRKIDQRGGTAYPPVKPYQPRQTALALDMVSAVAPAARILLVETDNDDIGNLGIAVDRAVAEGATQVSIGHGTRENAENVKAEPHFDHPGIAIVASTGDDEETVKYPASSPHVTAVAGTELWRANNPRGWAETSWDREDDGTGWGCSRYLPKPAFQTDTGWSNRTVADVSAVARRLASYSGGWRLAEGTAAAAAIIAGVYALAGRPAPGTYPNTYPYARPTALHDLNDCEEEEHCEYLWEPMAGYDAPTGLGTPNGLVAFGNGAHSVVTGTVTDAVTGAPVADVPVRVGAPVADVPVRAGAVNAASDAAGRFRLDLPPGRYELTTREFWHADASVGVTVGDGAVVSVDIKLPPLPLATLSGLVTDGSGHGWPLHSKIRIFGMSDGLFTEPSTFTDPFTGRYTIRLPRRPYQLDAVPLYYHGYTGAKATVDLTAGDAVADLRPIAEASCGLPSYNLTYHNVVEEFEGPSMPSGWKADDGVTPAGSTAWRISAENRTNASGKTAMVQGPVTSATLTSPPRNLTTAKNPRIEVSLYYNAYSAADDQQSADVEYSVDQGRSWRGVWHRDGRYDEQGRQEIPIPQAAGTAGVLLRFRFSGRGSWQVDRVFIGERTCDPTPGGLIMGTVTDADTGEPLYPEVSVEGAPARATATVGIYDPNHPGLYQRFSPLVGPQKVTVGTRSFPKYKSQTKTVDIVPEVITRVDFELKRVN